MNRFLRRHWLMVLGIALVVTFVLQNAREVEVRLLLWRIQTSLALILMAVLGAGFSAGWVFSRRPRR